MTTGELIKSFRKEHGYKTQKEFAERIGIALITLNRLENGAVVTNKMLDTFRQVFTEKECQMIKDAVTENSTSSFLSAEGAFLSEMTANALKPLMEQNHYTAISTPADRHGMLDFIYDNPRGKRWAFSFLFSQRAMIPRMAKEAFFDVMLLHYEKPIHKFSLVVNEPIFERIPHSEFASLEGRLPFDFSVLLYHTEKQAITDEYVINAIKTGTGLYDLEVEDMDAQRDAKAAYFDWMQSLGKL